METPETPTQWEQWMPTECPWCGSKDRPGKYLSGRCNNSWHVGHPDHRLAWPMYRPKRDSSPTPTAPSESGQAADIIRGIVTREQFAAITAALREACGGGDIVIRTDGTLATLDPVLCLHTENDTLRADDGTYVYEGPGTLYELVPVERGA